MKKTFVILTLLASLTLFLNFTIEKEDVFRMDISGEWSLTIDNSIDGNISGNNGCETIEFTAKGAGVFNGKYTHCSGSNNAKSSQFSVQVFEANRGNLINIIQDNNKTTQYYAAWSGRLFEDGEIRGIWTDVVGNQGEFKLTR